MRSVMWHRTRTKTCLLWQIVLFALLVCTLHVDVKDILPSSDDKTRTQMAISASDDFSDVVYADFERSSIEKTALVRRSTFRSRLRSGQYLDFLIFVLFLIPACFCGFLILCSNNTVHNSHTDMMAYIHDSDGRKS